MSRKSNAEENFVSLDTPWGSDQILSPLCYNANQDHNVTGEFELLISIGEKSVPMSQILLNIFICITEANEPQLFTFELPLRIMKQK